MRTELNKSSGNPLVTVIVITYNSAKYVIETLESAKKQTYRNIELIISDDCSLDNTVQICQEWLSKNSDYFSHSLLISNNINKGIAGNCNNGMRNSRGEWIKIIAGDDLLKDTSIEDYMNFVSKNNFNLFFAYPLILSEDNNEEFRIKREEFYKSTENFFKRSAKSQFLNLLISDVLPMNPATIFFKKEFVDSLGGFDEKFLPEDLPLYLKATFSGHQLGIMKKNVIYYRIHNTSLTFKGKSGGAINFYWYQIKRKIKSPYITWNLFFTQPLVFWEYYNIILWKKLTLICGNSKGIWNVLKIIRIGSPLFVYNKLFKLSNNWKKKSLL